MSAKSECAAKRFFQKIEPREMWDFTGSKAKPLIAAAFLLYERSWHPYDIRRWEWPFVTLDKGGSFSGDEPWTVLLRRAVEIAADQPGAHQRED